MLNCDGSFATNCDKICYKLRQNLLQFTTKFATIYDKICYKLRQNLLQITTKFVANYDKICCKLRRNLLQITTKFVTNYDGVTNCDNTPRRRCNILQVHCNGFSIHRAGQVPSRSKGMKKYCVVSSAHAHILPVNDVIRHTCFVLVLF